MIILLTLGVSLAACQKAGTTTQPPSFFPGLELTPYVTSTATGTATATSEFVPTNTIEPTITATPITYTVKQGDTLFSIAANHGLTTAEIKAANPTVNPYLVAPGMVILIPAPGGAGSTAATATQSAPAATPYPLTVSEPKCTPSLTGGLYCFADLLNEQDQTAGGITAEFQLVNPQTSEVIRQEAMVPLNRINSGKSLPLFAYFAPPVAAEPQVRVNLLSAVSANQGGGVSVQNPEISISSNGLTAAVSGSALLDAAQSAASKVWVAAVAYDEQGSVVGIRRFMSLEAVNPGASVDFSLNVYSIAGKILRVELFGEANP